MPTAEALKTVDRLTAFHAHWHPALRGPTISETRLIAEAVDHGATMPGFKWRAYFGGETESLPVQFEACYAGLEDETDAHRSARARRDSYVDRVTNGDLKFIADRVTVDLMVRAAQAKAA